MADNSEHSSERREAGAQELVLKHRAPVYNYLVRCGVDSASRDDLFQQIFIETSTPLADRVRRLGLLRMAAGVSLLILSAPGASNWKLLGWW